MFLAAPIAIALLVWLLRKDEQRIRKKVLRVILPLGIIVTVTVAAMAFYFWKTTGQSFQPPYLVYEKTYMSAPSFPWLPPKATPSYSSATMRNFYVGDTLDAFDFARQHPFQNILARIFLFWLFYLGPMLTIPFLMLLLALPLGAKLSDFSVPMRFLLLVAGVSFAGMLLPVIFQAHYAAPITALLYAFVLRTMRYIRPLFFGAKAVGLGITRAIVASCVLLVFVRISVPRLGNALTYEALKTWARENYKFPERPAIISALDKMGGLHLVFVKNGPAQKIDWVYNAADIDASNIVWARDLGPMKNQELIDYYTIRKVWMLDPNGTPPTLMPYPFSPVTQRR